MPDIPMLRNADAARTDAPNISPRTPTRAAASGDRRRGQQRRGEQRVGTGYRGQPWTSYPFAIAATAGVTNTSTAPITQINGNVVLDPKSDL